MEFKDRKLTAREIKALMKAKKEAKTVDNLLKSLPVGTNTYYNAIDGKTLRLVSVLKITSFLNNQKQSA